MHGDGHGHGDHHHHHGHGHDHHHHHGRDQGGDGRGPQGTEFLDLEISQVLASEAEKLSRQVALDIVREGVRERLEERLGEQLRAVGRLAADELVEDVLANLQIEDRIAGRRERAEGREERVRSALRRNDDNKSAPSKKKTGKKAARKR